jgi:transposase
MNPNELKALAAKLRAEGATYTEIGQTLGRTHETIRRWLNPKVSAAVYADTQQRRAEQRAERYENDSAYRERILEKERMRDPEYRKARETARRERQCEQSRNWKKENLPLILAARKSGKPKFKRALEKSRETAIKRGYMPCTASIEELEAAWDGKCYLCGDSNRKLGLEHNHQTGEFRGWACNRCNVKLAQLGDDVEALRAYLKVAPPLPRFKGVERRDNRWGASIYVDKERWRLGTFDSEFAAARAYDIVASAEGRFWNLNFPEMYGDMPVIKNREQVVEKATELRKQGLPLEEIANRLEVSRSTVQAMLRPLDEERNSEFISRFKEMRFGTRRYALAHVCKELNISRKLAWYWEKKLSEGGER